MEQKKYRYKTKLEFKCHMWSSKKKIKFECEEK